MLLNHILDINHLTNSFILISLLFLLSYFLRNDILKKILKYSILLNLIIFNCSLFLQSSFDIKNHLPLHLCYLTEIGIFLTFYIKNKNFISWMILNSTFGAIVALINSNLDSNSMIIEQYHFYVSHFNLALYFMITYRVKFQINLSNLLFSIKSNLYVLFSILIINIILNSNYWFTYYKPAGTNITKILPDWPYYFLWLIIFGLISYILTFLLLKNKDRNNLNMNLIWKYP